MLSSVGPTPGRRLIGEPMTQMWRSLVPDGLSCGGIEAYCYVVKVGREEPCVVIERRRGSRLMAKQRRNRNYRGSRLYGERRCGVAQVVRSDLQAQCRRSRIEAVASKIAVSQRRGVRARSARPVSPVAAAAIDRHSRRPGGVAVYPLVAPLGVGVHV